jgi:hypothetical protein
MVLLPSLCELLEPFAQVMTQPTYQSFTQLLAGWLLAGRHTITGALKLAGPHTPKHFSSYHRVFSAARWDLQTLGLAWLQVLLTWAGPVIYLVIDDTLCHHRGRKIFGAGMHYDPQLTSRQLSNANRRNAPTTLKSRGHAWVILGIVLTFPFFPHHPFGLPVLFRLFLNTKTAARLKKVYKTRPVLALEMLQVVCAAFPQRHFHLLVDSAYAGQHLLQGLPKNCHLTARWIAHPALYGPVPDPVPGQNGRPRTHGPRLDSVETMLQQRCPHQELDVYGKQQTYRLATVLACFFATPDKLLRIVAAEPLTAAGHPLEKCRAVFYSTCLELSPAQVIAVYAQRWSLEVTFHDAKGMLGLEEPQGTSRRTVERHAPVLLLLYTLVVVWFAQYGHIRWQAPRWSWYPAKRQPSFADMLTTLRQATLRYQCGDLFENPMVPRVLQNPLRKLLRLWKWAA